MTVTNRELHGIDAPLDEEIILKAGPFEAVFEPDRAYLRRVRVNGVEAVRNVYVHVRRDDWFTILPVVTMLDHKVGTDHFELSWKAVHRLDEIDFEWTGTLTGSPTGIHYRCEGKAITEFKTNRTTLCVLIPREFKGLSAEVEHPNGSHSPVILPEIISPTHPLEDMQAITVGPVKLTFEGEVFEAEDQRNWTDASYKAYPVLPPPYTLAKGESVLQGLRIDWRAASPAKAGRVSRVVPEADWWAASPARAGRVPSERSGDPGLTGRVVPEGLSKPMLGARVVDDHDDLGGLSVDYLRVDLPPDPDRAGHRLEHARSAGLPLQIVVERGAPIPELHAGETLIVEAAKRPEISVSPKPVIWLRAGRFDGFNMGRHEAAGFDGVEVSGTPQIHTFDERSILENAATLGDVIQSLRAIAPGADIGLDMHMREGEKDPRLQSLFGALWVLRSYADACKSAPSHLTLGETDELRYPAIAALMRSLAGANVDQISDDGNLVILHGSTTLIGNLLRTAQAIHLERGGERTDLLTPHGWEPCKFESGSRLDPYRIIRSGSWR